MVVFARPRGPGHADVTLEDDDVTQDLLEKPYVDMLGDSNSSSTLQRSLSARVRRRERVGCFPLASTQQILRKCLNCSPASCQAGTISRPFWCHVSYDFRHDAGLASASTSCLQPDHPTQTAPTRTQPQKSVERRQTPPQCGL